MVISYNDIECFDFRVRRILCFNDCIVHGGTTERRGEGIKNAVGK